MRRVSLFVFLAAIPCAAMADPGSWEQVGQGGAWKGTIAGAVFHGKLFSAEDNGNLYMTNLGSGEWQQIGKTQFGGTKFLFAAGDHLCMINKGGSMFHVDVETGEKKQVGDQGAWKGTLAGSVLKGKLYTTEDNGGLYVTDTESGEWKQIGKAEFGATVFMFAARDHIFTIENDGSLYKVDPSDGSWVQLGDAGAWKATLGGAVLKGRLYSTESNGGFYETNLENGKWVQLGKPDFGNTVFMFAAGENVYTIESDGSLYRVFVK
ncbi:MAG TPA: hypothetical protein VMS17_04705 [Gemmataceae bacterium]|nr:hypothetical protein [Gemmataceae bacterium]